MAKAKPDFCMRCPVGGTFNEADQTCSAPDPEDGLALVCVGGWAEQKHARVRKYVDISRAARRKFVKGKGGATYIDMFCGPGRARVRETARIIDGSALVAAKEAIDSKTEFSELYIADSNESFLSAAVTRLRRLGVTTRAYPGMARDTVGQITGTLPRSGLHFAFLDPYDLKSLPFSVIGQLATFTRMDILIHVSAQDLQRNLRRYIEGSESPLYSFAPRWRDVIDKMDRDTNIRSKIFHHWLDLIRACDMQPAQGVEEVTGTRNQHLYWLVFVARHKLAHRFWQEIRNVTDQKSWNF
jgi:three-Cys-motif partner protein